MMEFNNENKITPQIVKMTTNVDQTLNEIQVVFTQIVDELVASKFDTVQIDLMDQEKIMKSRPGSKMRAISSKRPSSSKKSTSSLPRSASGIDDKMSYLIFNIH